MGHDHDHANCDHDHDHDHDHGAPQLTAVLEELGPCKKLLKVEVHKDEVQKEIQSRLHHVRKTAHLKGFRKGKAPLSHIRKVYGKAVREDARDHLLRQTYMKALENELGLNNLLGEGTIENVDFSPEEGLKFEVTLHTKPEFEMPEYKGLEIKIGTLDVEESELEKAIDHLRRSKGELKKVEDAEAVVEGEDHLSVDVQVWLSDEYERFAEAQEEGDIDEADLKPLKEEFGLKVQLPMDYLGGYSVTDLADSLTGLKVGEWGDCETELAHDFEVVEGRGEPAVLRLCVQSIERLMLPELTEDWAKEAGFNSLEHMKSEIREDLLQSKEMMRNRSVEEMLLGKLRDTVGDFDLPSELLDKEIEQAERRRQFELRIQQGKNEQEAEEIVAGERDEIREEVQKMLRNFFLLDEVTKREEISVSESDVQSRILRMAQARGQDPSTLRAELEKHQVLGQLRHELLDERARAFLREHAKITESEDL
jgi:trigger factor